ncbi:MAG: hypothetical protein IJ255_07635 [Bacteroidales bacterium]|nr:hypothetical protein [Bacteroidales bacterium]
MKKGMKLLAAVIMGISAVACSSYEKMVKMAENVRVTCDPEILEVVADNIDADITVTYPADYFHPKAILEVTPVLVYNGGEAIMKPFVYQGEKVKDNYKTVSSNGQTVREHIHFDYVEGMEQAQLELRAVARYKTRYAVLPTRKVADGCNTTYKMIDASGYVSYKADNYQEVIKQTEEGQILYSINSADVANKELKNQSIKDFQAALDEIKANERKILTGTEVVAYASPDGGKTLNDKLSDNRAKSGEKAFNQVTKGKEVGETEVRSIGQDWEGFQELVSKSNIEDKDLILRVLSMYSDPAVRESEIKNMSEVYTSLKSTVLPELRRARFIANVEYQNYTSEELLKLVDDNIDVLDEEALLRAASLVRDNDKKADLYQKAADKFGSDRARFNKGVALLAAGKVAAAETAFNQVQTKDGELENALGVIALQKGDYQEAARRFAKAGTDEAKWNMGLYDVLSGNYEKAAQELADTKGCCFNRSLAYILADRLNDAEKSLMCQDARANYLRAIIAARKGDATGVQTNLAKVRSADAELAARAEKDIEFAQYR